MRKVLLMGFVLLLAGLTNAHAQEKKITGTVTSEEEGWELPGVNVVIKGTTEGTITDMMGNYALDAEEGQTLVFSFIGYASQEIVVGTENTIDVVLGADVKQLDDVVVTALGIEREEKSLGYAVQEIGGDAVTKAKDSNIATALSGKVAGVQIKAPATMGGSANVVIRGNSSLTGNNQALFVVDGVPVDNGTYNVDNQTIGAGGYDYGNLAADINPDDIESISVLKGAAASALYGSRAANGVILITTKKGASRKGVGVTINSGVTMSKINRNTLPSYQKEYGAGYAPEFTNSVDGVPVVNTADDASWGPKFDGQPVIHWDALDPTSSNFMETRPWSAPNSDPSDFFKTGVQTTNSIALDGGNEDAQFRISYTNMSETGILPNSKNERNTISFSGSAKLTEKFTASASGSYINSSAVGRMGTGYDSKNVMQSFNQWWQTNLDFDRLERFYKNEGGQHQSWNATSPTNPRPAFSNNPYWTRYENYNSDDRDRLFGNVVLNYELTDWLSVMGRATTDTYAFTQEERTAVGSADIPEYRVRNYRFMENNYDLMLNAQKDLSQDLSLTALLGTSARRNRLRLTESATQDGLIVPNFYSLANSVNPILETNESDNRRALNSVYGSMSFGYRDFLFLDLTARNDWSSTLPKEHNSYFYPSISTSFVFSELGSFATSDVFSFGKLRLGYAEVGNDAPVYSTDTYYTTNPTFGSSPLYSVNDVLNNPDLKSERKKEFEAGLELKFLQNRIGFNGSVYKSNTVDQILAVPVTAASGYSFMFINAGNIENKGIELAIDATPVQGDFTWNVGLNWSANKNKVVALNEDVDNLVLGGLWNVTINAREGEAYGAIMGTNFVYDENGNKIVGEDGFYLESDENEVIGNINPDWFAGLTNSFSYKNFTLSALIDMQWGGDVFSFDRMYGLGTGLYEETAGLNDKGNPKRNPVSQGGGILLPGVKPDGTPNDVYVPGAPGQDGNNTVSWTDTGWSYQKNPEAAYVYDATYIKLREVSLTYSFPSKLMEKIPFQGIDFSIVGRNLAILYKKTPGFDPEVISGAGNAQGISMATYPTTRTLGFNLKLRL
ncbi:SusC/RagA family TonB-linked outer membrane protein [Xanthovirga aplysinae]|uniref:SusC/RagA family TonB-linked outer membrane protein n=1 Tax=Xanthovirga aplysinae TaxID=2529853 RepID=UPI0012BB5351|nr:SusC/RagA family TonB-linked outer membrane protein [Xanthovirga aplysinae]MTI30043.1 SusC/RagA family TonB-linked outer membrane protein [Xanthovirga aplysinae]